jgi:hypothetical protein
MKEILFTVVFWGLAMSLKGSPLLVEKYQVGSINFPSTEMNTLTVIELSFSVDTTCFVQFAVGGVASLARIWLELDSDSLPPTLLIRAPGNDAPMPITYSYLVTPGNHNVALMLSNYPNLGNPTLCNNAYLQALIFLPDAGGAVAEQPASETSRPMTSAVISRGPYVSAPGASTVVDATGRVMENVLSDGRVQISNLPAGTYYAKDEERTVVKIVKVD